MPSLTSATSSSSVSSVSSTTTVLSGVSIVVGVGGGGGVVGVGAVCVVVQLVLALFHSPSYQTLVFIVVRVVVGFVLASMLCDNGKFIFVAILIYVFDISVLIRSDDVATRALCASSAYGASA